MPADHKLISEHPLQPFNPAYFDINSNLNSFQPHWYRYNQLAKNTITESSLPAPIDDVGAIDSIDLSELLRFLLHPVKYFFNQTLQLYFSSLTEVEQDDETFSLDALTRYQLLDELTTNKLADNGLDSYLQTNAGGNLPHSEVGKIAFAKLDEQADGFVGILSQTSLTPVDPVEVNLTSHNLQLLGWVKQLTVNGLLFYRPAKVTAKDSLVAWVHHVVLSAMGRGVKTRHIGLIEGFEYPPLEQGQAKGIVDQLVGFYLSGLKQPLPFFVKSSEQWAKTRELKEVAKMFNGSSFNQIPGEGDDLYIQRVFKSLELLPDEFKHYSDMVFTPLHTAMEANG
jgi:exodeoxyribonuclease V gamma subunit